LQEIVMKITKFDVIMNLWMSLVISAVLSYVLPYVLIHTVTWEIFLKGFVISFVASTVLVFVVPVVPASHKIAALFGVREHSMPERLLSTFFLACMMGVFMCLLMVVVNAGIGPWFLGAFLHAFPYVLGSVYVSALFGIATGIPLTKAILGIPKDAGRPPHGA
jgi:hypothetical protein